MKKTPSPAATLCLLAFMLGSSALAFGDAGVFTGNGQNLHQISSKNVQLVSIDVTIVPGRGPFLFDGSVPGMDQAEYYCTFVLKNLSPETEEVKIGFPVDSQFARYDRDKSPVISAKESGQWVSEYSFIARDERKTYHVDFVRRKPGKGPGEFGELFTWTMSFAPLETRTLSVQYRMPISMGLDSTRKDKSANLSLDDPLEQELLNIGMEQIVGYITSTGSSWAGDVEQATFTVITEPFERYLDVRGIGEEPSPIQGGQLLGDPVETYEKNFPVKHPWWFRKISPDGWTKVDKGIQWRYKNFKPQDPVVITYCMTEFPRLPDEVSPFINQYLENLSIGRIEDKKEDGEKRRSTSESRGPELEFLKQLLLATYGKEPQDPVVKRHAAAQIWYQPQKNFSMAKLSNAQKAILRQFDERITRENTGK